MTPDPWPLTLALELLYRWKVAHPTEAQLNQLQRLVSVQARRLTKIELAGPEAWMPRPLKPVVRVLPFPGPERRLAMLKPLETPGAVLSFETAMEVARRLLPRQTA